MHVGWPWTQTLVQERGTFQTLFVSWQSRKRSCRFVCAREERNYSVGRGTGWGVSCFFQVPGNRRRSDRCSFLMLRSVDWLLATEVSGKPISLGLHDPWNETTRLSRNVGSINSYQSTLRNTPEERNFHLHSGDFWLYADDCKSSSPFHHRVIIAVQFFFLSAARQSNSDPGCLTVQVPRSHTDTHRSTPSNTLVNEWSARRRGYAQNTQHTQQTNIHALSGIQTRDSSNEGTSDLYFRSHGHRNEIAAYYLHIITLCRPFIIVK